MRIDGAGEIHHVARVAVGNGRQHEDFVGKLLARAARNAVGTDQIDVERQVRTVLLDGSARNDADLVQRNRVVDFGPGQFFRNGIR